MDVQPNSPRERVFSILNDNDSPSFVIRQKQQSLLPIYQPKLPSIDSFTTRLERPQFLRQEQYQRNSSVSSSSGSSSGTPPLLRYDSHSSKGSSGSMDSTPSPITPAYNFSDSLPGPYDVLLRTDLSQAYLPSPTTVTPFMEQQMMIAAAPPLSATQLPAFEPKAMSLMTSYPVMPAPQTDFQQMPTPTLSNQESMSSASSSAAPQSKTSPTLSNNAAPVKKNKYPCPYAASHNCLATFTTSGHAARHGKKHTGEKGVHCPVCNKAFTRKDNMKQHERTHKDRKAQDDSATRSKAAITKDAQKAKAHKKSESQSTTATRRASLIQSPVSDVASIAPKPHNEMLVAPIDAGYYTGPSPPTILTTDTTLAPSALTAGSLYPPLGDEPLMSVTNGLPVVDKLDINMQMPPTLIRGFSDLDTLAQAAAADYEPYYQSQF